MRGYEYTNFNTLKGYTLKEVVQKDWDGNDALFFETTCGLTFCLTHIQDCCENVGIEYITGDLQDLVGEPVLVAEESSNREDSDDTTWTFYKIATRKGYVDLRWQGSSNGYYSESVDFLLFTEPAT